MLKRHLEKEIMQCFGYSPAVAILGARQTGKTTLAKEIARHLKKKSLYLDIENPNDRNKLADAYQFLDLNSDKLIIMDEVQLMPELFSILRPLIDSSSKKKRFLLLGSASPTLIKGVSESLAGRVAYTYLHPFNLTEVKGRVTQRAHWFRGGFPKSLLARNESASIHWLDDFISSYIEKDLAYLFNADFSKTVMFRMLQMLAGTNGAVWNAQNFSRSLGLSNPTINRYLDILEGAFFVRKLPAWFVNSKKRMMKSPRIYISDSGILHRLNRINSFEDLSTDILLGSSWEGYVVEQVLQIAEPRLNGYFYRTQDGSECDLVLTKGIKPIACIEIKYSNSPKISKGFHFCINELKTKHNFVITPSGDDYLLSDTIRVCSLGKFLEAWLDKIN